MRATLSILHLLMMRAGDDCLLSVSTSECGAPDALYARVLDPRPHLTSDLERDPAARTSQGMRWKREAFVGDHAFNRVPSGMTPVST
jgi:hypothetical protein